MHDTAGKHTPTFDSFCNLVCSTVPCTLWFCMSCVIEMAGPMTKSLNAHADGSAACKSKVRLHSFKLAGAEKEGVYMSPAPKVVPRCSFCVAYVRP